MRRTYKTHSNLLYHEWHTYTAQNHFFSFINFDISLRTPPRLQTIEHMTRYPLIVLKWNIVSAIDWVWVTPATVGLWNLYLCELWAQQHRAYASADKIQNIKSDSNRQNESVCRVHFEKESFVLFIFHKYCRCFARRVCVRVWCVCIRQLYSVAHGQRIRWILSRVRVCARIVSIADDKEQRRQLNTQTRKFDCEMRCAWRRFSLRYWIEI